MSRVLVPLSGRPRGRRTWGAPATPPPVDPPPTEPPPAPPEGDAQVLTFTPDTTSIVLNPHIGWMHRGGSSVIADARDGDSDHPQGYAVVWTDVNAGSPFRLDDFRFSAISAGRLDAIRDAFAEFIAAGITAKVRFVYSYNPPPSNPDATRARIEQHAAQLAPILDEWQHAIASVDAGFVGRWGEWNASGNGITDWTTAGQNDRIAILNAILAMVPETRMVSHRNPIHVRERFGSSGYAMSLADRFTGSDQSRVGWLNDSYVANQSHGGTYDTWGGHPQPDRYLLDRATFHHIGQYAVGTGETSDLGGLNEWNTVAASIDEMEGSGIDTLFRKFWTTIINRWIADGGYPEISRRLGYRLALLEATIPTLVTSGAPMDIELTIQNTGFGKVYNPRAIDLILKGASGTHTARLTADARRDLPLAGQTTTTTYTVNAPAGLTPDATYQVELALPDPNPAIANDPRYSIRLLNTGGFWNATTGRHELGATVQAVAAT